MSGDSWFRKFGGSSGGTFFAGTATLKPLNESNIGILKNYLEEQDSNYR